jgi:serine/threonine protein kinase
MELCDETLFHVLCRKQNGFSSKEIQKILLQLNEVFKRMNYYNISHRDIKLNNILIKYLNKEKTRFKVLLSDYGISNQLYSLTQKFNTHAGSQLIMAPEILNDEKYNNKCDLWSLGIII